MGRERIMNDIGDQVMYLVLRLERFLGYRTEMGHAVIVALEARALQLEDPHLAPGAAQAIMDCLWPSEDPPPGWWATEAGLMCARAIGYHRPTALLSVAASILNVSRQRVSQLCDEERLIRVDVPRDGITRDSIRYELLAHGRRVRR